MPKFLLDPNPSNDPMHVRPISHLQLPQMSKVEIQMQLNDKQVDLRFLDLANVLPKGYGHHAFQQNQAIDTFLKLHLLRRKHRQK